MQPRSPPLRADLVRTFATPSPQATRALPPRPAHSNKSRVFGLRTQTHTHTHTHTHAHAHTQVAVINMRACGNSPVTSPLLFSAYRGANDDVRLAVAHLRKTRLNGCAQHTPYITHRTTHTTTTTHTNAHVCMHTCTHTRTRECAHTYTHTQLHTQTLTHPHTHTHTHTHTVEWRPGTYCGNWMVK